MAFVDQVIFLVEQKGITKNKLLTDLSLSKNAFVDWRKRGNTPSGQTLLRIAEYFDVPIDYLLANEGTVSLNGVQNTGEGNIFGQVNGPVTLGEIPQKTKTTNKSVKAKQHCLSKQEEDLLRIFNNLGAKNQHKVMSLLYELEEDSAN